MPLTRFSLLTIGLSFVVALIATPTVRALARRFGMVARPKADRWHTRPTALLGGLAIFGSVLSVALAFVPLSAQIGVVLAASTFLFAPGLLDDLVNLKPYQKLVGQIIGAGAVIACGLVLPWTGSPPCNMAITLFWLVGITNAVNLLDNMDGLAAGIAAIASAFLTLSFLNNGQTNEAVLMAVFGASLIGFLVYNANPATIFMGDCGSLFIGFFLASSALLNPAGGRSRSVLPVLAVPVLTLFVPIFDTLFVMVLRKLAGRPISRGGRDHTSHRLVTLGLSERRAVWMLYGFATLSGVLGLLVRDLELDVSIAVILGFSTVLVLLGVHLAGVKVYTETETAADSTRIAPLVAFLVDLSYKRRVFEVLLDVVLIGLSYYASLALVLGPVTGSQPGLAALNVLPALVILKIAVLLACGVYRGLWRYVSLDNLIVIARAVAIGSASSVLFLLAVFRFEGFSRAVFVLDGLLLLVLMSASRMSFRLLLRLTPPPQPRPGRRVLIYGAGDAGDLLARELLNNPAHGCLPVGFVDDDPRKKGKVIHGLRVFGGNGSLAAVCEKQGIDEVLISSRSFREERIEEIAFVCRVEGLTLRRMRIEIEPVTSSVVEDSHRHDLRLVTVSSAI